MFAIFHEIYSLSPPPTPTPLILGRIKLKGHSLGLLTLTYWLSRFLLSTIYFLLLPDANIRIYWERKDEG